MSNVESSGGRVFEEVEFCELSSPKKDQINIELK